ncbi:MAG: tRNA pseudouridine(13) synthase TruD [Pseudomonadota bacterium]
MDKKLLDAARAYSVDEHPFAWGGPAGEGILRVEPEDFFVDEDLGFEPRGEGEHLYLQVEKRGLNTPDVARALARGAKLRAGDVSYAGLKDRHAVTRQWFSLYLPGKPDPSVELLEGDGYQVLNARRHPRKLRRGALWGNYFRIRLRQWSGDVDRLAGILEGISQMGFPNYFGAQRFGRGNSNLIGAAGLFNGQRERRRTQKGFYLSAARSWLFNQVLARRVADATWNLGLDGEVYQKGEARGLFTSDGTDEDLEDRCRRLEIHPTGPLPGMAARVMPSGVARVVENEVLDANRSWVEGLEQQRVDADRRALRALAHDLEWQWDGQDLLLAFRLRRGAFATALLREIGYVEHDRQSAKDPNHG